MCIHTNASVLVIIQDISGEAAAEVGPQCVRALVIALSSAQLTFIIV